ncbi:MAG TPA: YidC/Oxa1 family membrane protein insertase [Clostridiaceae bacterium]|jgi:membrane protein insertase, yidC/oxa1 family|nr:YidC/Oxa1 family membrane protein insertase [Clostridiaceae bacterium]
MFQFIANIFGYLLEWLYNGIGQNYGIALILFTIILRIILLPLTIKQQKSMKKTTELQGKMQEIQFKYKNNPELMNKEIMDLYKRENLSPFSGCISSIVQILIILSVFYLVSRPLTYMKKIDPGIIENYRNEISAENDGKISNYYEIEIIQKKAAQDENIKVNMDFLGLDLSKVPSQNMTDIKVYIIPILYVISSIFSIKMTTGKTNKKEQNGSSQPDMTQQMNKSMSYMMPIMAVSIAFVAPLGLALYWLISNILMILERIVINKYVDSKEEKTLCLK